MYEVVSGGATGPRSARELVRRRSVVGNGENPIARHLSVGKGALKVRVLCESLWLRECARSAGIVTICAACLACHQIASAPARLIALLDAEVISDLIPESWGR